jgi:hypothetical protein
MQAHRSLQRTDVTKYPATQIALMVASEFLRASSRAQYPQIVHGCFARARELMGILETMTLEENVAVALKPIYELCTEDKLMVADQLPVDAVRTMSQNFAQSFERASEGLKEHHA